MDARNSSDQDVLAGEVMESLGEPKDSADEVNESHDSAGAENPTENRNDPLYVQKRLKQQRRSHERDIRGRDARIAELESQLSRQAPNSQQNPYGDSPVGVDEQIQKAVAYALNHRDMEERKAKEAESQAHVQRQYNEFAKHLDSMNDKYDDFDETVKSDDVLFTTAMRDYALTLPKKGAGSAGEVLYHLAKKDNRKEFERIRNLHPLDQAAEMARLSHALISGGESKSSQHRPLGQIKTNPVTSSHNVTTDKTPIGNIRQRMKSGSWK